MAKHQEVAKKVTNISEEAMRTRLTKMEETRDEYLKRIEDEGYEKVLTEMRLQRGNSKTGETVYTVSLIPILDCLNCKECRNKCYDLRNVCWQPAVQNDRARNSALRMANPKRFWERVGELVRGLFVRELRINIGGDLRAEDFGYINKYIPKITSVLFFTKNYKAINEYLDHHRFGKNIHPIMSAWAGMEMENPHNLPSSHVLWADGTTTAPEFGSYYCGGNCTECRFKNEGCWTLKKNESVIFLAH